jgi:maltooligosyltrehalose trehalohydrolase
LPQFGPYLKPGDANTWGDSLNLDGPHSDEVRRYILDNVRMWLTDFRVDGLRLDADGPWLAGLGDCQDMWP